MAFPNARSTNDNFPDLRRYAHKLLQKMLPYSLWVLIALTAATSVVLFAFFVDDQNYFPYRRYREFILAAIVLDTILIAFGLFLAFNRVWQPLTISLLFLYGVRSLTDEGSAHMTGLLLMGFAVLMAFIQITFLEKYRNRRVF